MTGLQRALIKHKLKRLTRQCVYTDRKKKKKLDCSRAEQCKVVKGGDDSCGPQLERVHKNSFTAI